MTMSDLARPGVSGASGLAGTGQEVDRESPTGLHPDLGGQPERRQRRNAAHAPQPGDPPG